MKTAMISLLMAATLLGCNKDGSGNGSSDAGVVTNFALTGSGQDAVAQNILQKSFSWVLPSAVALTPPPLEDLNGSIVDLNSAWIVLKKIQFHANEKADASEGGNYTAHCNGPFFIDLLSDTPASFGEITLPETGLRRVKMLLHKDNKVPATAPSELVGKSIYLNGIVNSHNFVYVADDTTDLVISGPNAVVPEEGKDLLAVIRLADIFKKIDLSGINADTTISSASRFPAVNPCPEIHANASDLYTCFVKGMASEARFGKDNGDKDLDGSDETVN